MDTLHAISSENKNTNTTAEGGKNNTSHSSRSPSSSRFEKMSRERDRDSGTFGVGGGGGSTSITNVAAATNPVTVITEGTGLRFRNQSPSTRRSRERSRKDINKSHHHHYHQQQPQQQQQQQQHTINTTTPTSLEQSGALTYNEMTGTAADLTMGSFEDSRLSGNEELCYQSFVSDEYDGNTCTQSSSSESKKRHYRHQRTNSCQALDRLNTKIQCTKESIRKEQTARDDNVNEYLKLAASADKQQLQRIKAVFEKKNQKSAHTIQQLQKKLENYTKRVKDLQNHQYQQKSQHRQPREMLRDVGQGLRNVGGNIRDGITGFSGSVMSKPREFAHLIKNKFGSADNINQMSDAEINALNMPSVSSVGEGGVIGSNSTPNNTAVHPTSAGSGNTGGAGGSGGKFNSDNGSECSSVTSESIPAGSGKSQSGASQYHLILKSLLTDLQERKEEFEKLKERVDRLEAAQKEYQDLTVTLESERYRAERLEEQINDLTELHQNEIENLKQTIADMEEKVQYQSDERLRDVNEVLENCQTRISKMEHLSQQQYVTVEGIDNSNARALVVKLINVVLTILQVILLLVATAAGIIMPFLKTRVRVLTTLLSIFFFIFVIRQWPDVRDIGAHIVRHLKEALVVK